MHDTRALISQLADLLRREHAALGDFIVALADFDRERRWIELGYTSCFYFLHRELGLSKGAAYYRKTAAELLQRYPELVEPLRDGRLCITSVVELAKVITPENRGEVVQRFFHASKAQAREVVAELCPTERPPQRNVVTAVDREPARPDPRLVTVHGPEIAAVRQAALAVSVARGGPSTIENLRVTCAFHNQLAAQQLFGEEWMDGALENSRRAKHQFRRDQPLCTER